VRLIRFLGAGVITIFYLSQSCFSQQSDERNYPSFGGGVTFGYNYFSPKDLNDYIDLQIPSTKKDHINTGIDVGLFLIYSPNEHIEIIPEFSYLYSRHAFEYTDLALVVNYTQLGGTVYYIKPLQPGINLRFGGGLSHYWGKLDWEYPNSVQTYNGSTIGFHGAVGGDLILSPKMSMTLLVIGKYAKISQLKNNQGKVLPSTSGDDLELNVSGIGIKLYLNYYL